MYQFISHVKIVRNSLDQTKRYCGSKSQCYYDILGISKDASKKDIREAFIKLSKKIHPDKSTETSAKSHRDFIKINEAYNVLSKDHSRQQYDHNLKYQTFRPPNHRTTYNSQSYDGSTRSGAYYDDMFYRDIQSARARYRKYKFEDDSKFDTKKVVFYCFLVSLVGTILQVWAIIKSPVFNREEMNRKSEKNFNDYQKLRHKVLQGNNADIFNDLFDSPTEFDTENDNNNNSDRDDAGGIKW